MNRELAVALLAERGRPWDLLVIGGGATGLGVALDAQSRGLRTLLVEQADFAAATSSRSTKLIHGGVRYLPQLRFALVRQALAERALLLRNAPDLVRPQGFLTPAESRSSVLYYRTGFALYDSLARFANRTAPAGNNGTLPRARRVGADELAQRLPNLRTDRYAGGVRYFDAQFDDAGLAVRLAEVFAQEGGTAINYARVVRLTGRMGKTEGAVIHDLETAREHEVTARCVVNATGVFSDVIRTMDDPTAPPRLTISRGSHIVIDSDFLGGEDALLIPRTADGRVLFAIPWMGRVVVGTTDVAVRDVVSDPRPTSEEIDFLLHQLGSVLRRAPAREDVCSVFAGLRPLLRGAGGRDVVTQSLSREHSIEVSESGLVTIAGGKWTTYRRMAAETVDVAIEVAGLERRPCRTATLPLVVPRGDEGDADSISQSDADRSGASGSGPHRFVPEPVTERLVRYAVRHQMARTVEDVVARRSRWLVLDARSSIDQADRMARWMADELGRDDGWIEAQLASFRRTAATYLP